MGSSSASNSLSAEPDLDPLSPLSAFPPLTFSLSKIKTNIKKKIQEITSVDQDVEKKGPLGTVSGDADWYSHYGKQYEDSSKKLKKKKRELPCEPVIPLLSF